MTCLTAQMKKMNKTVIISNWIMNVLLKITFWDAKGKWAFYACLKRSALTILKYAIMKLTAVIILMKSIAIVKV